MGRALTGAWIETAGMHPLQKSLQRRALTGAWIETPPMWLSLWRLAASRPHGRVD